MNVFYETGTENGVNNFIPIIPCMSARLSRFFNRLPTGYPQLSVDNGTIVRPLRDML
jgi:hypothetical protein